MTPRLPVCYEVENCLFRRIILVVIPSFSQLSRVGWDYRVDLVIQLMQSLQSLFFKGNFDDESNLSKFLISPQTLPPPPALKFIDSPPKDESPWQISVVIKIAGTIGKVRQNLSIKSIVTIYVVYNTTNARWIWDDR